MEMKLKKLWQNKKQPKNKEKQREQKKEEHFNTVFDISYLFCFFITLILTIVKAINNVNYDFFPNFFKMIVLPDVFFAGLIAIILWLLGFQFKSYYFFICVY